MGHALLLQGWVNELEAVVRSASGPVGLVIIAVYSFLIAFVLPLPSEVVLAPVSHLRLGLPTSANFVLVVLVSSLGKAAGSVFAFRLGQEAKQAGPIVSWLRRSKFRIVEWSETQVVTLAQRYGYVGLAIALAVPGFPDTLSIYAFAVLEEDYWKFAAATFAGSVGRLLVFAGIVSGGVALF